MNWEQLFALAVGVIGLPFIYWMGFDYSYKAGRERELREMAQLDLNRDPKFRLKIINEQLNIFEEQRHKNAYENE